MSSGEGDSDGESYEDESDGGGGADEVFNLLRSTIKGISSGDDPIAHLTSFCQAMAFVEYDEDLDNLPLDEIVPLIVKLMQGGGGVVPEVMLMSARVLTYFVDRIPKSAKVLEKYGAIEALCRPLMEIEYFDVAEQCMDALKKLSNTNPVECLKAGVIKAVLSFFDFFEISQQKAAVSTMVNMCQKIPEDCFSNVMDAVPTLCSLLDYQDRQLVESTATCLMMIVENFSHSSWHLEDLCKQGVIKHALNLISPDSPMTLSETTYVGMIELLVQLASRSLLAVNTLYELNVASILRGILGAQELSRCTSRSHPKDRSADQIYVAVKLICQLIPSVSHDGQDTQLLLLGNENIIIDNHMLSLQFATNILPALMQVVNHGEKICISYGCVSVTRNYVSIVDHEMLRALISNSNVPKFLASLLSQKDPHLLIPALKTVEIIMKRLPGEFLNSFVKEGVIHMIRELSKQEDSSQLSDGQSDNKTSADLSRCLCYVFEPRSCPLSSESKVCKLQRHACSSLARHLLSTAFTDSVMSDMPLSENMQKLKACCSMLDNYMDNYVTNSVEEDVLSRILDEVVKVLREKESMSTFEFIESGFMRSFVHYLTIGHCFRKGMEGGKKSDIYHAIVKRLQTVTCLLFSGQRWQNFPLISLVEHLQNALSTLECFPVVMSSAYAPMSKSADIPSKHSTTNPCLQVLFVREDEATDLCCYNNVVTVVFSSSLDSIERFLWPKVNKRAVVAKCANRCRKNKCFQEVNSKGQFERSPSQSDEGNIGPKLMFLLDGKLLDRSITLYQAVLQGKINEDPDMTIPTKFWDEVHTVTFKRAKETQPSPPHKSIDASHSFLSSMLLSGFLPELEISNPCYDVIFTMNFFERLNRSSFQMCSHEKSNAFAEGRLEDVDDLKVIAPSLAQTKFINSKLTAKLEQQIHDRLAVSTATMPLWCTQLVIACPFLFSFEARLKYFNLNMFGMSRNKMQNFGKDDVSIVDDRRSLTGLLPRKKFRVHRNNILCSAAKMMSWYASRKVLLETEFFDEVGTGLGPTMEFYTLVSLELQKVGMGMWRGDHTSSKPHLKKNISVDDSNLVRASSGLFPRPWANGMDSSNGVSFSKVLKNFFLLGQILARAIRDRRILNLSFSRAFYKLILNQDLDIYDIQSFDPELGRILIEFQALVKRKRFFESNFRKFSKNKFNLSFRNTVIEDLCLDFTLPGYPDYLFSPRSGEEMVNTSNLEEYISFVVDATLRAGVSRQFGSFKSGFNKVFPIETLQIFTAEELERMLCGEQETWNLNELQDHINFDHGYTLMSPPVIKFLEIIQEFDACQHRAFLLFVTGAPRLPSGGLAALKPKLTVVCKHCNNDADMELPSVMTCANYLKLPPYSSKERMREKLLYAIMEGQGAFHLS